ncbi:MAG: hypothetical protein H6934_04775 [Burkholderiaceae bacterium]|nr:hypothetical protein [Burkholderiaceae bacterium]
MSIRSTVICTASMLALSLAGAEPPALAQSAKQRAQQQLNQAKATLQRLGCVHDLEYQNGVVVLVRCPLKNLAQRVAGLDSIRIDIDRKGKTSQSTIAIRGTIEGRKLAMAGTLGTIYVLDVVRVVPLKIRTRKALASASGNTVSMRFDFASAGKEFELGLKQPNGGTCVGCLPDLHWDNGSITVAFTFAGSSNQLRISSARVSSVKGNWDLAGKPAATVDATLRAVGMGGAAGLRREVSKAMSSYLQREIDKVMASARAQFEAALAAPLKNAFGGKGQLKLGYHAFNSSIVAEYRP